MKLCKSVMHAFTSLFSPDICLVCNKRTELQSLTHCVCQNCWNSIPAKTGSICSLCGRSLASKEPQKAWKDYKCQECREKKRTPYKQIRSLFYYELPIREMIHLFKFEGMLSVGKELSKLLANSLRKDDYYLNEIDLIVPVPLHIFRHIGRGFNQSEIIAEEISKSIAKPVATNAIKRVRHTAPQSRLHGIERHKNLTGAFIAFDETCKNKRVLLVDDVVTTGITIKECARALKRAGAKSVSVVTISRAESP